jgi:hypothetical protein
LQKELPPPVPVRKPLVFPNSGGNPQYYDYYTLDEVHEIEDENFRRNELQIDQEHLEVLMNSNSSVFKLYVTFIYQRLIKANYAVYYEKRK